MKLNIDETAFCLKTFKITTH